LITSLFFSGVTQASSVKGGGYTEKMVIGDFNADGQKDTAVCVWAPFSSRVAIFTNSLRGAVNVSGANIKLTGETNIEYFSSDCANAGVGDVDGNGYDDLMIGAPYNDAGGGSEAGAAYIVLSTPSGFTAGTHTLAASRGIRQLLGKAADDNFGSYVGFVGDTNGNGRNEFIAGAPYNDDMGINGGQVWFLYTLSTAASPSAIVP
jgi:hypothetical protein